MSESNNSTVCTAASSVEATVNDVSAVKVNMELVNPPLRSLSALNAALASGDALAVKLANEEMFIKPRQIADPG